MAVSRHKITLEYGDGTRTMVDALARTRLGPSASQVYRNCVALAHQLLEYYRSGYTQISMKRPETPPDGKLPIELDALMRYLFEPGKDDEG